MQVQGEAGKPGELRKETDLQNGEAQAEQPVREMFRKDWEHLVREGKLLREGRAWRKQ